MNIDITRLRNGVDKTISIKENIKISDEKIKEAGLIDIENLDIDILLYKNAILDICAKLKISGELIMPCSVTLKPVKHEFFIDLDDELVNLYEEIGEIDKNIQNTIDILPIIWENILMEIPMRVVSENASFEKTSGEGWKLLTEEKDEILNPEFAKLMDLFK